MRSRGAECLLRWPLLGGRRPSEGRRARLPACLSRPCQPHAHTQRRPSPSETRPATAQFEVSTKSAYAAGQQVFISYGPQTNTSLLQVRARLRHGGGTGARRAAGPAAFQPASQLC